MRHTHPRITSSNENILSIGGIATDESERVDRLHHLARPAKFHCLNFEAIAGPLFELAPSLRAVMLLAGLVIFATNDQDVMIFATLDAQVVIRLPEIFGSVPEQYRRNRSLENARADYVGCVRRLLGMNHHAIVDRRISCDNDRVGFDGIAAGRRDVSILSTLDLVGVCARENLATFARDRARQSC